ncbi:MAG: hypothetical protein V4692_08150 [Bdellovibrionota bacterium]
MRKTYQIGTAAAVFLVVLAFQNCGQAPNPISSKSFSAQKVSSGDLNSRYDEIKAIASADVSCAVADDCVAVGVGGKNCGLPSEYVVTSKNNNLFGIEKLNEELARMESQYMAENDMVAVCGAVDAPTPSCVSNACVIQ